MLFGISIATVLLYVKEVAKMFTDRWGRGRKVSRVLARAPHTVDACVSFWTVVVWNCLLLGLLHWHSGIRILQQAVESSPTWLHKHCVLHTYENRAVEYM